MIAKQTDTATYTSLKDILPASPLAITSPTNHSSSWHQVPIKNPLVKQAALAYLHPMVTPPDIGNSGFFGRLKDKCCGECGCLGWLDAVVFRSFRDTFCKERTNIGDCGDDGDGGCGCGADDDDDN